MPRSPIRRKSAYTPPPAAKDPGSMASAPWVAPLMVTLFVVGLLWIVVYYVTQSEFPIGAIGNWNMLVGFGFIIAGFLVSTRWR